MTAIQEQNYPRPLKLTVDNFMALHRAGAFEGLSKVELIEGELLTMSPQHRPHVYAKTILTIRLFQALQKLGSPLLPMVEGAIRMSDLDAPEPDIVLTDAPKGSGLIPLASVALAVEVADSSVRFDSGRKAKLYATHRIPEYWVLGIAAETIEQMWHPVGGAYADRRTFRVGDVIESATIPGLAIESDGLI
jgi:Uma2 family endonuclease